MLSQQRQSAKPRLGTNVMTWFLQHTPKRNLQGKKKKKEGNEEKESLGLNTSALFHEDLSTS